MSDSTEYNSREPAAQGAPDRGKFLTEVHRETQAGNPFAVLVMDVERLRELNLAAGHDVADLLLAQIGGRLAGILRDRDILARTGGGTFALLLTDMLGEDHGRLAAAKAVAAATRPYSIEGHELSVTVHTGLALSPDHGTDAAQLLSRAEIAMYRAKSERTDICVYDQARDIPVIPLASYERELRSAIERNELHLEFQPKIMLQSGALCGAETLARWPECPLGPITPARFVQIAEQSALITDLTLWTVDAALRHCADWHRAGAMISVSVNISTRVLLEHDLPELVARSLATWGVPARYLFLEITETALMARRGHVESALRELGDMGVVWSIDDFGSGYSSLAYLQELPVRELKIDRTFIHNLNERNSLIVRAIVQLAHGLGLSVTAEGVESATTRDELVALGCDVGQGFLFGRPRGPDAFLDELERAAWSIDPDCGGL